MRLGFLLCTATPEASCSVRCGSPERAQCTVSSEINPSQSLTYFPGPAKKKNSFGSPTLSFWFGIRSHRSDLAGLAKKRTSVQTGIARSKRPLVRFKHPFLAHFLSVQNRPDSQKDILIRQKSLWVGNVLLKGKKDLCLEKRRWEKVYCRAPCTGFWSHARHPVCAFAISTPRAPARAPSPAASVTTPSRPRKGHSQPRSRARG